MAMLQCSQTQINVKMVVGTTERGIWHTATWRSSKGFAVSDASNTMSQPQTLLQAAPKGIHCKLNDGRPEAMAKRSMVRNANMKKGLACALHRRPAVHLFMEPLVCGLGKATPGGMKLHLHLQWELRFLKKKLYKLCGVQPCSEAFHASLKQQTLTISASDCSSEIALCTYISRPDH